MAPAYRLESARTSGGTGRPTRTTVRVVCCGALLQGLSRHCHAERRFDNDALQSPAVVVMVVVVVVLCFSIWCPAASSGGETRAAVAAGENLAAPV